MLKRILQAALVMLAFAIPSNAVRVFERSTVANLPFCGTATEGLAFYVTDAADSEDCSVGSSTTDNVCICSGGVWSNDVFDIPLNEVLNPTGNKTFQMTTDMLKFSFTNPVPTGNYEGAFEIEATANFGSASGDQDLVHIHQHTGNPGTMFALHIEGDDVDNFPVKIVGAHSTGLNLQSDEGIESDARFQLGSSTTASASCASLNTDRWYGDKDCDETKDAGEEYFDLTSGGSITFDIGDDGGNDSTALSEIATIRDDYAAITESSADKALIDFAKIPPYQQYDPNRPPSSCAVCEEWTNDTATQTWAWQNQESSTETLTMDGALLIHPTDLTGIAVRYLTNGPDGSAGSFVISTRITPQANSTNNGIGLFLLATGTAASPTLLHTCTVVATSVDNLRVQHQSWTSYTSAATTLGTFTGYVGAVKSPWSIYLQIRYDSATKIATCWASNDGFIYISTGYSGSFAAHPTTTMGMAVWSLTNSGSDSGGLVHYWRARTDANRNLTGE